MDNDNPTHSAKHIIFSPFSVSSKEKHIKISFMSWTVLCVLKATPEPRDRVLLNHLNHSQSSHSDNERVSRGEKKRADTPSSAGRLAAQCTAE